MTITAASFRHEATFYAGADDFLAAAVPFLVEGLESGEPALVALGPAKTELLRRELGDAAAEINFADIEQFGRNPARIIPVWREFVDRLAAAGGRGIGEPVWPGRAGAEIEECQRHESLLNVAFGDGPGWSLLCPYDSSLPDEVLAAACHSHPHGHDLDATADSGHEPEDPFAGELPPAPSAAPDFGYEAATLHELRAFVARGAAGAGLADDRTEDLIIAASELAANSVIHGGGSGVAAIWSEPRAVVFEARDAGRIVEPLVGRVLPAPAQASGRGLWMANQVCDLVQIRSSERGTTVRLRVGLD